MKISKKELEQIIKEEIQNALVQKEAVERDEMRKGSIAAAADLLFYLKQPGLLSYDDEEYLHDTLTSLYKQMSNIEPI